MPENRLPAAPLRNSAMTALLGFDVWSMDGIDLPPGAEVALTFESVHAERRQGVFVATEGVLSIEGARSRAFNLWFDTAARPVRIRCEESTSGRTILYNIFEGETGQMSQGHTSGMLIEPLPGGGRRYRCCDVAPQPVFDRIVFSVQPTT
jgi:hypothetical protein